MSFRISEWLLFAVVVAAPLSLGFQTFFQEPRVYDGRDYRDLTTHVDTSKLFSKDNNIEQFLRDQLALGDISTSIDRNIQYYFRGKIQNQVILGKEQQLYLGNQYGMIEDNIRGTWTSNKQSLRSVRENVDQLNKVSENLAKLGKEFVLIVAPSKESVYQEELPNWYSKKGNSVADFYNLNAKFKLIDLRPPLRAAKLEGKKVFYTNGTHWNHLGAYIGMKSLHVSDKELFRTSITPLSRFRKLNENARNVQVSRNLGEEFPGFGPEIRLWEMMKLSPLRENIKEVDYVFQNLDPKWSLCKVLSTADFTTCRKVDSLPSAVVFRDSFAEYAQQYLSEYFSSARFVVGIGIDSRMVRENNPDIVILMLLERTLIAPMGISEDLLTPTRR